MTTIRVAAVAVALAVSGVLAPAAGATILVGISSTKGLDIRVSTTDSRLHVATADSGTKLVVTELDNRVLTPEGSCTEALLSSGTKVICPLPLVRFVSFVSFAPQGHDRLRLTAGVGDCLCVGGSGDDTLIGADGADLMEGGAGNDVLRLGPGPARPDRRPERLRGRSAGGRAHATGRADREHDARRGQAARRAALSARAGRMPRGRPRREGRAPWSHGGALPPALRAARDGPGAVARGRAQEARPARLGRGPR
jgi:hypothetical protein